MAFPYGQPSSADSTGRTGGRWRYERRVGRGIALRYVREAKRPPSALPARSRYPPPEQLPPLIPPQRRPDDRDTIRVLCTCGRAFTFVGLSASCPSCGRPVEWPTMGLVERQMRDELDELLSEHEAED